MEERKRQGYGGRTGAWSNGTPTFDDEFIDGLSEYLWI